MKPVTSAFEASVFGHLIGPVAPKDDRYAFEE